MVAKVASIVDSGCPNNTNRLITEYLTTLRPDFSLNNLLLCYLAMVMGDSGIDDYKKCRQINKDFDHHAAGAIQRVAHCPMERIRGFMQSH
jgi:hypothetical protein